MAARLAASPISTTVWARRPEVATRLGTQGASVAQSPAEVGAASDVVSICVFDAAGIDEVVFGPRGVVAGLAAGGIVMVHSTVSPEEIKSIAERAAIDAITVLDAPVSGGGRAVDQGQLLVLLAGPHDARQRVRPVLDTYAGRIVELGEVGSAQAAKLINNAVFAANVGLVVDALRLGALLGLDSALLDVLCAASGRSYAADVARASGSLTALANGRLAATISKDLALLERTVADGDASSSLLTTARQLLRVSNDSSGDGTP